VLPTKQAGELAAPEEATPHHSHYLARPYTSAPPTYSISTLSCNPPPCTAIDRCRPRHRPNAPQPSALTTRDPCPFPFPFDGTSQCALTHTHAIVTCTAFDPISQASQCILALPLWTKPAAGPRKQDTRRDNNKPRDIASDDCRRSALVIPAKHDMGRG
jgi:hypothetical protein